VFLPRRKEGENLDGLSRHVHVAYEDLESLFHLPLKDAAREVGLCRSTFKKACRRLRLENWPYRKGGNAHTQGVDAVVVFCTSSTLQTPELHHTKHAVVVPAMSSFGSPFSSIASSSSSAGSTSAALRATPFEALQLASTALVTRSYGEARDTGPAFQLKTFAPHDPPSYIEAFTKGLVSVGGVPLPMPEGLPTTQLCGGGRPGATLETGSPRERSCVEAVMAYLDLGRPISEADVESMLANDC